MADAISIEETNRIRISLGMKPLPTPNQTSPCLKEALSVKFKDEEGSTLESRQAEAVENFRKLQEAEEARKMRNAKATVIKKARDAAQRFSKLQGKGLADDDNEDLDTKTWLMKQKKRQKQIEKVRKIEMELAEAEIALEYTDKDLAGIKVGHEFENFKEGEEQILILKDTTIDENEEQGDELENLDLREREKASENSERKKKKPIYNPMDIDELENHSILAQYDEEIDGKKIKNFTLNGKGQTIENIINDISAQNKLPMSLEITRDEPQSDYLPSTEIGIKKPKKKKAKSIRKRDIDDDLISTSQVHDLSSSNGVNDEQKPTLKKRAYDDISFVDDEDLQRSLAAQRVSMLKKRQRLKPESLVQQIREQSPVSVIDNNINESENNLIIDETSEFVANIQKNTGTSRKQRSILRHADSTTSFSDDSDVDGDVKMIQSYKDVEHEDLKHDRTPRENSISAEITNNGLEQEATLERGLGSTLKLLKERGILRSEHTEDLNAIFRQKQLFLAEKQRREAEAELKARAQRERDRSNGRLDRMTAREKEEYARSQNALRDQIESRQLAEHFNKEYRPNVELKYIDEFGRSMNEKEAFKHLSHQFHGKGSGKQKTEKVLKKIEDEKRRLAQSSLDGSQIGGMSGVTAQQRKKQGQAGVRLA